MCTFGFVQYSQNAVSHILPLTCASASNFAYVHIWICTIFTKRCVTHFTTILRFCFQLCICAHLDLYKSKCAHMQSWKQKRKLVVKCVTQRFVNIVQIQMCTYAKLEAEAQVSGKMCHTEFCEYCTNLN